MLAAKILQLRNHDMELGANRNEQNTTGSFAQTAFAG